jgi:predicted nucleotidyltransferase component of viral defense system
MNLEGLRQIAAQKELSLNFVAKDEMLSKALIKLQGHQDLILKGGTGINRVYLKNKRFSEDIDFDLILTATPKQALARTNEIIKPLSEFEIAIPRIMNLTIRYDLSYTNPLNYKDKIRVEFRVVNKAHNFSSRIVNFGYVPLESALLNVYDLEELIWHKLACILSRKEGKDLFDLYYLLELPHTALGLKKEDKEKLLIALTFTEKEVKLIAKATNNYIPLKLHPAWSMMIKELKEKINKENYTR